MGTLRAVLHEIIGLFVDDGSLALALVVWCALVGLLMLAVSGVTMAAAGAALLAGCVAILLVNVVTAARKRRSTRAAP
jgi:membrane associated rhomboid family serine protease